jgi:hypothetical protein
MAARCYIGKTRPEIIHLVWRLARIFPPSPASRKRRQKGNPVSNETVKYGLKFYGTWTREWQRWQGPVALVGVNYNPVLSSGRAPHTKNPQMSVDNFPGRERNIGRGSQKVAWYQDRLTDWPSVVNQYLEAFQLWDNKRRVSIWCNENSYYAEGLVHGQSSGWVALCAEDNCVKLIAIHCDCECNYMANKSSVQSPI